MTFSDEDLKRLKDGLDESDDWEAFNFNCVLMPKDIKALLARLEAAEKLNEWAVHSITCIPKNRNECPCGIYQADKEKLKRMIEKLSQFLCWLISNHGPDRNNIFCRNCERIKPIKKPIS